MFIRTGGSPTRMYLTVTERLLRDMGSGFPNALGAW
jgi:hypothetical protein